MAFDDDLADISFGASELTDLRVSFCSVAAATASVFSSDCRGFGLVCKYGKRRKSMYCVTHFDVTPYKSNGTTLRALFELF